MGKSDLLIAGGIVVSPHGRSRANVAVVDGKISYIGSDNVPADQTVDASGLLVMPGGVDTHVHLMDPADTTREDFPTGTSAAAAAGVTTIIEHTHGTPVRTEADLREKIDYLEGRSNVDYGLAAHAWPGYAHEVPSLWRAGISFFKVFTCTTHGVQGHDAAALMQHLEATARVGAISLFHSEDQSITKWKEESLRSQGRSDGGIVSEWRNRPAELVAVSTVAILVRLMGARGTIAHVSSPEVAEYIAAERRRGAILFAESCPQYFLLRESECLDEGALRKFTPPARARSDQDERVMWELLRTGVLTHISTDHAPATKAQKADGGIWSVPFGLPGIDTTMTALLDAAARGFLSYEDVARVYSEKAARIYGLWPRKGCIGVGSDADVVLVDPHAERRISDERVISKAGWTPYAGRVMRGRVVRTYLRGELVAEDGAPVRGHTGRFLPGSGAQDNARQ